MAVSQGARAEENDVPRFRIVGLDRDSRLEMAEGGVDLARVAQRVAEIVAEQGEHVVR